MKRLTIVTFATAAFIAAAVAASGEGPAPSSPATDTEQTGSARAIFAGGCFWCVEADFDKVEGVRATVSGYSGGHTPNPTYKEVTWGDTGHYEVVEVTYDPAVVGYRDLVDYFWRHVDPTDAGGQFCDRGDSYRTAVFVADADERAIAEASLAEAQESLGEPIVTPILDAGPFTAAEDYHQDYYEKNALKYNYYRWRCGRDQRIEEVWSSADTTG